MSIGIYKIENLITGKIYIGQSIHIERRWQEHCQKTASSLIGKAIQKYGKENFSFQILQEVQDTSLLNDLESYYIKKYNSLTPNGYNIVLIDSQEHHQFNKYSQEILFEIIDLIKNSDLSFQTIADKYNLDLSMIYYLNRGDYHTLKSEIYPLRPTQDFSKKKYFCIDCGAEITKNSCRCSICDHIKQRKVERPNRDELKILIRNNSFVKLGKQFNVSDNTIRKWCKNEKLPYKSSDIKRYSDDEWKKI